MTDRRRHCLYFVLVLVVPGAAAFGWWSYQPRRLMQQAECALAAGDVAGADALVQQLLRQSPDQARTHFLRARLLRLQNRPTDAQGALYRAVQLGLDESEGRREFGLAEARKGFTVNAEKNLLDVIHERPDDLEVLQNLAEGYARAGRWAEAERYYSRWQELQPDKPEVRFSRGLARLESAQSISRRLEEAAVDFGEALHRDPNHFEARLKLAECLMKNARMREAKQQLSICRQVCPDRIEVLIGLAICAVEDRNWKEARLLAEQALRVEPRSLTVMGLLGDVALSEGNYAWSVRWFQRMLKLAPENRAANLKVAQALQQMGQFEAAKEYERRYERALAGEITGPHAPAGK